MFFPRSFACGQLINFGFEHVSHFLVFAHPLLDLIVLARHDSISFDLESIRCFLVVLKSLFDGFKFFFGIFALFFELEQFVFVVVFHCYLHSMSAAILHVSFNDLDFNLNRELANVLLGEHGTQLRIGVVHMFELLFNGFGCHLFRHLSVVVFRLLQFFYFIVE